MKTRKYRNVPTKVDNIVFASKREARRYSELKLMERAGLVSGLDLQPRFPLNVNGELICTYVADFTYQTGTGTQACQRIVEDVKGVQTPEFKLKSKLMKAIHGVEIKLT